MNRYVVNGEHLAHNLKYLKKKAKNVPIWAVIKGDGYGLGALPLASLLKKEGIENFCVTECSEAELLRRNGFSKAEILMLRDVSNEETLRRLLALDVILTAGSKESAQRIGELAARCKRTARVHLKIDTGMGRYGFLPHETEQIKAVYGQKNLSVSGIYTHFNCAFNDKKLTLREFEAFRSVVDELQKLGFDTGTVHCCNSSAFLKYPEMHLGGVRLGSAILGRMPFGTKLRPVGECESRVDAVRVLPKGHTTGYGAVWKAKKDTKVAIVPVGWYHGFHVSCKADMSRGRDCLRAALSALKSLIFRPKAYVEIKGKRCPVIGAIGMLHCAVDVSRVDCAPGDTVRLQISPLHVKGMEIRWQ